MNFRLWLEQSADGKRHVFCDLDETLVHQQEIGWLKDDPKNKNYAKMLVPGKHPYPGVVKSHTDGKDRWVFPRPGAEDFLKACSKFAEVHVLTHAHPEYIKDVISKLP